MQKNIPLCSNKVSKPGKKERLNNRDNSFAENIKKLNILNQILKINLFFQQDVKGNTFNILHNHSQWVMPQLLFCTATLCFILECKESFLVLPNDNSQKRLPWESHRSRGSSDPGLSQRKLCKLERSQSWLLRSLVPIHMTPVTVFPPKYFALKQLSLWPCFSIWPVRY